ncbi:hypothetical protein ERO13_D09G118350v2 [Gossypium hirsutum]|uniref:DNA helicase Pif1-like 2B domain-containing protein n=1 Tax=Gossypium mustelinum TaxID=34275 RepID=A0A5D2TLL3_GOSMU|nr:hypothetical protein ERO13_D09G118350v2 [Gossypium hirsutum]TYI65173.1 hypothetical protein E1A91_D09G138800v1 [Gossypium mustelinum]
MQVVNKVNDFVLLRIPGESRTYPSSDKIYPASGNIEEQSLLYSSELKVGVPIMLLRNINRSVDLCCYYYVETITGSSVGQHCFIPRVEVSPSGSKWPSNFRRRQFPIKLYSSCCPSLYLSILTPVGGLG